MNISFRSHNPDERILSNFAATPFSITLGEETFQCASVEGFWQGLKSKGDMRKHIFLQAGLAAKKAGSGKKSDYFEIADRNTGWGARNMRTLSRRPSAENPAKSPRCRCAPSQRGHPQP